MNFVDANPLKKQICRSLINTIRNQKKTTETIQGPISLNNHNFALPIQTSQSSQFRNIIGIDLALLFQVYLMNLVFFLLFFFYDRIYRVVQKKRPILLFIQKLCFTIFFHIFQAVQTTGLGDSFDINMDPTRRFTTQQWIKIIEAYFATKSVLLTLWKCSRDFGRDSVPGRRTIQRLMATFGEAESVVDAPQRPQWSTSFKSLKSNNPGSFSIF